MDDALEYHYNETEVNLRFFEILRRFSDNQNDPTSEWEMVREMTKSTKERCICSTQIIDNYYIRHKRTGKVLVVGSECIKRWMNPKLTCERCHDPLGRVCLRIRSGDYLCRKCKRLKFLEEEAKRKEEQALMERLAKFSLYWYGKYYMKPFHVVAEDIPYTEHLLNHPSASTNESLKAFCKYVNLIYEIAER